MLKIITFRGTPAFHWANTLKGTSLKALQDKNMHPLGVDKAQRSASPASACNNNELTVIAFLY